MDIPFKLTFYVNQKEGETFSRFNTDFEDALMQIDECSFQCKELNDFRLSFESQKTNLELWIELMDMLPLNQFTQDEKERITFKPSSRIRPLYLNWESKFNTEGIEYSPFLPGTYRITVYEDGVEKYFSFLIVNALHINKEQLDTMRDEIESILSGLAKEVISKQRSSLVINEDSDIIQKYHFLISKADSLISNLALIKKEPRFNVKKVYISKSLGLPKKNDLKTIKYSQSNLRNSHKVLSYRYELNYNISINRNLKEMLKEILKSISKVESYISGNLEHLEQELRIQTKFKSPIVRISNQREILNKHSKIIKQVKANIQILLKQNWLNDIEANMNNQDRLPRVPYYRSVYYIYQQLKKGLFLELNPFQNYIYVWKESSKLYEIWGFLKILLLLKENSELKINKVSGWIFNEGNNRILPLLGPETVVTLSNSDELEIVLRYDSFIVKYEEECTFENPIVTIEANNRPDLRVDIYYKKRFKKCFIIDFKYRNRNKLGSQENYRDNNYGDSIKVYRQLKAYSEVRSFYLNRNKDSRKKSSSRAITNVFGIFPVRDNKNKDNPFFEVESLSDIIICALSPGLSSTKIENKMVEIIFDVLDI